MSPRTRRQGSSLPSTQRSRDPAVNASPAPLDQSSTSSVNKETNNPHAKIESLFRQIDGLKKSESLSSALYELKTEVLCGLFKTVQRVDSKLPSAHGTARSYASVLAGEPAEKPVPPRDLRQLHIKRLDMSVDEANLPVNEISQRINERFRQLSVGQALNARQLPSGDIILLLDSADAKTRALQCQQHWLYVAGSRAAIRPKKHSLLVHGVPVSLFSNDQQEEGIKYLHEQNPAIASKGARIIRLLWRQRTLKLKKTYSSLLIDVETASGASTLIREGLVLNGEIKDVKLFDPECLITRCYKCQRYGHNAKYCQNETRCALCAAPGHQRAECPSTDIPAGHSCVNCSGSHPSGNAICPKQIKESEKAKVSRFNKPQLFKESHLPSYSPDPPTLPEFMSPISFAGKKRRL